MPFGDVSLDAPSFPSKTIASAKGRVTADRAAGGISTFQVKHWGSPSKIWAVDAKHFARFKQSFHQNYPTTKKLHPPPKKKKQTIASKWMVNTLSFPNTKHKKPHLGRNSFDDIPPMLLHNLHGHHPWIRDTDMVAPTVPGGAFFRPHWDFFPY